MILHPFTAYIQDNKYPISNTSKKIIAFRIRMIDGKKPQRFFSKIGNFYQNAKYHSINYLKFFESQVTFCALSTSSEGNSRSS